MTFQTRRDIIMLLVVQLTFAMIGSVTQCAPAVTVNFEWAVSNANSSTLDTTELVDQNHHGPTNINIFISAKNLEHHQSDHSGGRSEDKQSVSNNSTTSEPSSSASGNGLQDINNRTLFLTKIKVELLLITNNGTKKESSGAETISLPLEFHVDIVVPISTTPASIKSTDDDDDDHQVNVEPTVSKKNKFSHMLPPLPIEPEEQSNEGNAYYPSILKPQDTKEKYDPNNHQQYNFFTTKTPVKADVGPLSTISFPDSAEEEVQTGTIPLKWLLEFFKNVRNNVTSLKFLSAPELQVRDLRKIIPREFLFDVTKFKGTD